MLQPRDWGAYLGFLGGVGDGGLGSGVFSPWSWAPGSWILGPRVLGSWVLGFWGSVAPAHPSVVGCLIDPPGRCPGMLGAGEGQLGRGWGLTVLQRERKSACGAETLPQPLEAPPDVGRVSPWTPAPPSLGGAAVLRWRAERPQGGGRRVGDPVLSQVVVGGPLLKRRVMVGLVLLPGRDLRCPGTHLGAGGPPRLAAGSAGPAWRPFQVGGLEPPPLPP